MSISPSAGKVTNPMEEVTRTMELPQLYRTCYDVPFCLPAGTEDVTAGGDKGDISDKSEVILHERNEKICF